MELKKKSVEEELAEKEEIIAALTAQLEQAAEQLDRYHRAGARGENKSSSSAAAESALSQIAVLKDLARFLEQWDHMQFGPTLGRLEVQVGEVRDLVANGVQNSSNTNFQDMPQTAPQDVSSLIAEMTKKQSLAGVHGDSTEDCSDNNHPSSDNVTTGEQNSATDDQSASSAQHVRVETVEFIPFNIESPNEIDLSNASPEEISKAFDDYQEYASSLIKHIQAIQNQSAIVQPNWEELQEYPEEFRKRIEDLERQLENRVRIAEVSLSMERARLAREQMRLQQLEMQINKRVFQLGLDPTMLDGFQGDLSEFAEGTVSEGEMDATQTGWKNLLGFKRNS